MTVNYGHFDPFRQMHRRAQAAESLANTHRRRADHYQGLADEHALFDAETDVAFKDLDTAIENLQADLAAAERRAEHILQQAQGWKFEAVAHRSIVCEIYQLLTGATGEPGTWNGAAPVRDFLAKVERLVFAARIVLEHEPDLIGPPDERARIIELDQAAEAFAALFAWENDPNEEGRP